MKGLHGLSFILLVIGGLNWLAFGLFQWEIGELLGGPSATFSRVIYVIVGLAAVCELLCHKKLCKNCDKGGMTSSGGLNQ